MATEHARLEVSIPGAIDTETIPSLSVGGILDSAWKAGEPALLYIDGRPEFEGDIVVEDVADSRLLGIRICSQISQAHQDELKGLNFRIAIGSTHVPTEEVLQLASQSIVRLDKSPGDPVDLLIDDELHARGDIVVSRDTFGIRITELMSSGLDSSKLN